MAAWFWPAGQGRTWRFRWPRWSGGSTEAEAGFSLVEVLAALIIASLALVMAMQVMVQSARLDARLTHETAARDLGRRLLAEGAIGQGQSGVLDWQVTLSPFARHLVRRDVQVTWAGGGHWATWRIEPLPVGDGP